MRRPGPMIVICLGLGCGDAGPGGSGTAATDATTPAGTGGATTQAATGGDATGEATDTGADPSAPTTDASQATTDPSAATTSPATDPGTTGDPTTTSTGETSETSTGESCLGELLSAELYAEMFPNRNALFTHEALMTAAAEYPLFACEGTAEQRRRELAAFLANIGHETTGGWPEAPGGPYAWGLYFKEEVGCEGGQCVGYCDPNNVEYPCAPGKTYHGRGPIQLSWNYNYGPAGAAIGEPLLTQPELITSDGAIAFRTALWFWMTAQAPKPSAHDVMIDAWQPSPDDQAKGRAPGFGMTINIINGGLECGQPTNAKVEDRVGFYQRFTTVLAVDPGPALYCDAMQPY